MASHILEAGGYVSFCGPNVRMPPVPSCSDLCLSSKAPCFSMEGASWASLSEGWYDGRNHWSQIGMKRVQNPGDTNKKLAKVFSDAQNGRFRREQKLHQICIVRPTNIGDITSIMAARRKKPPPMALYTSNATFLCSSSSTACQVHKLRKGSLHKARVCFPASVPTRRCPNPAVQCSKQAVSAS